LLKLANAVTPQVRLHVSLEKLRGPLEPFVRAAAVAGQKQPKGAKHEQVALDARPGKRAARDPPAVVGLYQLEELIF